MKRAISVVFLWLLAAGPRGFAQSCQIDAVSPVATKTTPGSTVSVWGAGFTPDTWVYFDGMVARETTFSNSAAVGGTAYLNGASGSTTIQVQLMQAWTPFAYDPGINNGTWALDDPITGEALNAGQVRVFYTGSICGATGGTQGNGGQGTLTLQ